jgi:lipopolysaccharide biosynthesis regulator YciM
MCTLLTLLLLFAQASADPVDAQGWFTLGVQRFDARDYRGALDAFEHARQMQFAQIGPLAMRTARAYAQLGDKEKAFTTLKTATDNGFANVEALLSENDLILLRTDPRWAQTVAATRANQRPCSAAPEYRQFDYWLGEWDVESGGQ